MRPTNDELRAMFGSAPASFSSAMEDALKAAYLPSEKEVRPMKRIPRVALIAALMLAAMMAVAYAVGAHRGIMDYFKGSTADVQMPAAGQEQMRQPPECQVTLGPIDFTLTEALCDPYSMAVTWVARLADEAPAVFLPRGYTPEDPMSPDACAQYGVEKGTRFMDAAKQLKLPLYYVSARTEPGVSDADTMLAYLCEEQASISLMSVSMLLDPEGQNAAELATSTAFRVVEYDPATGEPIESRTWQQEGESLSLPMQPVTATRRYLPEGAAEFGKLLTVEAVQAEQTCLGAYLTLQLRLQPSVTAEAFWEEAQLEFTWLDENGQPFPEGLTCSTWWDESQMPLLSARFMLGLEELPPALTLTQLGDTTQVILK